VNKNGQIPDRNENHQEEHGGKKFHGKLLMQNAQVAKYIFATVRQFLKAETPLSIA
jgi:hypothetical protein